MAASTSSLERKTTTLMSKKHAQTLIWRPLPIQIRYQVDRSKHCCSVHCEVSPSHSIGHTPSPHPGGVAVHLSAAVQHRQGITRTGAIPTSPTYRQSSQNSELILLRKLLYYVPMHTFTLIFMQLLEAKEGEAIAYGRGQQPLEVLEEYLVDNLLNFAGTPKVKKFCA